MMERNWVLLTLADQLTIHRFVTQKAAEKAQRLIRESGGDAVSVFVIEDCMTDEERVADDFYRRKARHGQ
jgi:hypothetical protein